MSKSRLKSLANAVGAKTARACDSCVKRRARWYCAADDAFLCQSCDGLVHSVNPLARRHERVRLNSTTKDRSQLGSPPATWDHGFTRKPRTPRGKKTYPSIFHDLVPEISFEDQRDNDYEPEEQLICQVPVLEQFLNEPKIEFPILIENEEEKENVESCLNGFFPTDMELEEFAADVETLLGRGLDTESYATEELMLSHTELFSIQKDEMEDQEDKAMICEDDRKDENGAVPFEYESHKTYGDNVDTSSGKCIKVKEEEEKNVLVLRLNYDLVISTWGGQGPPWTSGQPPKLDIDFNDSPTVSMGESHKKQYVGGFGDGGREARVSRYREKRRKRLFSKKIRYEVRRLNAEKRPRMKGRFVKRAFLAANSSS